MNVLFVYHVDIHNVISNNLVFRVEDVDKPGMKIDGSNRQSEDGYISTTEVGK